MAIVLELAFFVSLWLAFPFFKPYLVTGAKFIGVPIVAPYDLTATAMYHGSKDFDYGDIVHPGVGNDVAAPTDTPVPVYTPTPITLVVNIITAVPPALPVYAGVSPTSTPYIQDFIYTWYNPKLLAKGDVNEDGTCAHMEYHIYDKANDVYYDACHTANCWNYDLAEGTCKSTLANGERWEDNFEVAVACPLSMKSGTVIKVYSPPALAGTWICKDTGGFIDGNKLDFLRYAGGDLPWWSPIKAEVYPP